MEGLGERISNLRNKMGISQEELAKRLSIGKSTLGMYETNKREPDHQMTVRLAELFMVSVDQLISGKGFSNKKTFGQIFKKLREKNGWTQEEMADKLDVSRPSIAGYESKDRNPRQDMLRKIADVFGVSTDYLLGREEAAASSQVDEIIKYEGYFELELSSEEMVSNLNIKVDNIVLTEEELNEIVDYVRFKRLMKSKREYRSR